MNSTKSQVQGDATYSLANTRQLLIKRSTGRGKHKIFATHSKGRILEPDAECTAKLPRVFRVSVSWILTLMLFLALSTINTGNVYAASCGAEGQRGCKITFKRLKTCNKGLHLSLKTRTCVRNKRIAISPPKINLPTPAKPVEPHCGKLGNRGCKITFKRLKACDKGLHLSLKTKRCVKNKPIAFKPPKINLPAPKLDHPNCGKLGFPGCKITLTRLKSCDKGLHIDLKTRRCTANKLFNAEKLVANTEKLVAKQTNCGGRNQKPCIPTLIRPKACDFGYKRNADHTLCIEGGLTIRPVSDDCGAEDQRACKKWEAAFACRKGLRKDPASNYCVVRRSVDKKALRKVAAQVRAESETALRTMGTAMECVQGKPNLFNGTGIQDMRDRVELFRRAIDTKDVSIGVALAMSECIGPVMQEAQAGGYNTVALGLTVGGGAAVGGFIDQGFAFHVPPMLDFINDPERHQFPVPTFYQTKSASAGWQLGASTGISIGLFKDAANTANLRGSDTHGFTSELIGTVGVGVGIWFKYDGSLDGVSAAGVVGVKGGAAVYNRANTSIVSLSAPNTNVADCGAANQRACKVWERVPMCDNGTRLNATTEQCLPLAQATLVKAVNVSEIDNGLGCGGVGERVCRVHEQVPGCNAGLRIDYQLKVCAY